LIEHYKCTQTTRTFQSHKMSISPSSYLNSKRLTSRLRLQTRSANSENPQEMLSIHFPFVEIRSFEIFFS
jgi:hypothetical protein